MTHLTPDNQAYEAAFRAMELLAAAANIDMRHLHFSYRSSTAVKVLRREAATMLWAARAHDKLTAAKVWKRHRKKVTSQNQRGDETHDNRSRKIKNAPH